jgi:hypothetical protein
MSRSVYPRAVDTVLRSTIYLVFFMTRAHSCIVSRLALSHLHQRQQFALDPDSRGNGQTWQPHYSQAQHTIQTLLSECFSAATCS